MVYIMIHVSAVNLIIIIIIITTECQTDASSSRKTAGPERMSRSCFGAVADGVRCHTIVGTAPSSKLAGKRAETEVT